MKRSIFLGLLALVLVAVITACSSDDPTATPITAPAAEPTATPEPVRKEVLRLAAQWGLPFSGHPADNRFNTTHFTELHQLPIFGVDPHEEGLDKNYGVTRDYTIDDGGGGITMKLRKGLTFHSGEPITAEDIAFSFELSSSEHAEAQIAGGLNGIGLEAITVVDEETVRIDFEGRSVTFAIEYSPMVNPVYVVNKSAHSNGAMTVEAFDAYRANPDGAGPYKFLEGQAQSFITLEAVEGAHPLYGKPLYDRIEFRNVAETGTRMAQLRAGEVDIAEAGRDQVSVIEGAGARIGLRQGARMIGLYFFQTYHPDNKATNNMKVRQAISHAIDSELIAETIFGGIGTEKWGCTWPPSTEVSRVLTPAYDAACAEPYEYNPDKAKKLLADAGFAPGELEVNLTFWGNYPEEADMAEAMQPMIEEIGINTVIDRIDRTEWSKRRNEDLLVDSVIFFGPGGRLTSLSGSGSVYGPKRHLGPKQDVETMAALAAIYDTGTMQDYAEATAAFSKLIHDRAYGSGFFAASAIWGIGEDTADWGIERSKGRGPLALMALVTDLNP